MGKILFEVDISEITESTDISNYNFEHASSRDVFEIIKIDSLFKQYLQLDLSTYQQEDLDNCTDLTIDQCITIMKNSTKLSGRIAKHNNLPIEVLTEYAEKLPLYYMENQINITPEFFHKYRDRIDVSSFLNIRSERGDVFDFFDAEKCNYKDFNKFIDYKSSRTQLYDILCKMKPEIDTHLLNRVLDDFYNHEVNSQYLAETYNAATDTTHTADTVCHYYSINHEVRYDTWVDFVEDSIKRHETAIAATWFRDVLLERIVKLVEDL